MPQVLVCRRFSLLSAFTRAQACPDATVVAPRMPSLWPVLGLLVLAGIAPRADAAKAETSGSDKSATTAAIHICVDRNGGVSYQSDPCGPGQRTREVRTFRTVAVDPQIQRRTREIEREMDRRNHTTRVATAGRSGAGRSRPATPSPCQTAKDQRKRELARVGLKRNFDLLSRLDGAVWDACKGL